MTEFKKRTIWWDSLVIIPFLVFIFFYETNLLSFFFNAQRSTYHAHVEFALKMVEIGNVIPHFLYHLLVIGVSSLFPPTCCTPILETYLMSGYLVSVVIAIALFVMLFIVFRQVIKRNGIGYSLLVVGMALFFMMGSAINALTFLDHHALFGYFPLNVYNSPTYTLLKLVSVPLFLISLKIFMPSKTKNYWLVLGSALCSILCAISKPSFTVIIIPALGLVVIYKLWKKDYIDWILLLLGILLPSAIVLGWQYSISFGSGWENIDRVLDQIKIVPTRIAFVPFGQFVKWGVPLYLLLPKLLLSVLFPLTVYITFWKKSQKDLIFNLGWLLFLFGCLSTYLFVEIRLTGKGGITQSGNFGWSGLIGLYILFISASLFWLKQISGHLPTEKSDGWRFGITIFALALHWVFGIIWYFDQFRLFSEKIY